MPRSRHAVDRSGALPWLRSARSDGVFVQSHSQQRRHGAGTTHAWADIYLPGAGWIAYDPTNGTVNGSNLIRVAATRDISQAVPVAGSFCRRTWRLPRDDSRRGGDLGATRRSVFSVMLRVARHSQFVVIDHAISFQQLRTAEATLMLNPSTIAGRLPPPQS